MPIKAGAPIRPNDTWPLTKARHSSVVCQYEWPKDCDKRIYDDVDDADGQRVLVDRLWPRGVSKKRAQLDYWFKDVAPSPELRSWWDHDPEHMDEFADRYEQELSDDKHASQVD